MRVRRAELRGRVKADLALRFTQSGLTSFAGLELVRRYFRQLGLVEKIRRHVGANAPPTDYGIVGMILVVLTLLIVGGRRVWHVAHVASDPVVHRLTGLRRVPVFFAEWIEPPFCAGHWLPEMIELAGGSDVLGRPGEPSHPTTWAEVLEREPELVVLGPCGFGAEEAAARAAELRLPCPAYAVDGDGYYSRPAPRLADGVRQLAHLFHPDTAPDPGLTSIALATL